MAGEASQDGRYYAYYLSTGGSDWQEANILEIETGLKLEDHLQWLKVTGLAWFRDGFFYSRYDAPDDGHDLSSRNEGHKVYYHRLGTQQTEDELIYEDPTHPQRFHTLQTTEDERFAILTISERGEGKDGNALYFRDLTRAQKSFTPIIAEITNDRFYLIDNMDDRFLIMTNQAAPNGRIAFYDDGVWKNMVPESGDSIAGCGHPGWQALSHVCARRNLAFLRVFSRRPAGKFN